MILLDDFREEIEAAVKLDIDGADECIAALDDAAAYVFDANLVAMAADAISKADEFLPYITLPSRRAWLEFDMGEDGRIGLFTNAEDSSLRQATGIVVRQGAGVVKCKASNTIIDLDDGGIKSVLSGLVAQKIYGCIALLSAPDVIDRRMVSLGKLNKKREKRNRQPLKEHEFVRLKLQRIDADRHRENLEASEETGQTRRLHFVRSHLRFVPNRGISLISPHWRGDPKKGTRAPKHLVSL